MTSHTTSESEIDATNNDLYQRIASCPKTPMPYVAGRGTETRELPETSDSDLLQVTCHAAGLPAR